MVNLLNEKLKVSLRKMYNTVFMKMIEFDSDISTVESWISAFNHVGSSIVNDDTKASSSAGSHPSSSNSQGDKPLKDND